jgi:acyl-coenzyme A synthetase/AMP-(fatty) acid ligase
MTTTDTNTLLTPERRLKLASDPTLGAGNFIAKALAATPTPDAPVLFLERPFVTFWGESFLELSLRQLDALGRKYAAFYLGRGVTRADPVGVYLEDGIDYLVHYTALTAIGAIPVLTNGNMPLPVAAGHFARVGAVLAYTDEARAKELRALGDAPLASGFYVTDAATGGLEPEVDPSWRPYVHADTDPIMIAHSSGTTGVPKPVLLQHQKFFHGVRYRLNLPAVSGGERILSSLPHSHNAAIAYVMLALLAGTPVMIASDHSGPNVLRLIETFKPTMVVSFPQTYVEICEDDLDRRDLASVELWFNGGDAAHEAHIRKLVRSGGKRDPQTGVGTSKFVDGMGSSEMGFSLFRHVHTANTNVFGRCVGKPLEWVEAKVFGDDGAPLGARAIGRLGVKAATVTSGYWNDSVLSFKSQIDGFWLTGDLAYYDDEGRFFHVDRVPDRVLTEDGPLYSLRTEELLMKEHPEILDCSVVAAPTASGSSGAVAFVRLRPGESDDRAAWLARLNATLANVGWPRLAALTLAVPEDIPLGATGKVLKRELRARCADLLRA